jgi:voltage-gated potassium channel
MIKRTWYTLMYIAAALFAASTALTMYSGIGFGDAIIWNVLSSLNIFYASVILPFQSETTPFVLAASMLDGIVFALLTVLVASWFFSFIRSINVRGLIVLSRIKRLKGHIIVVPFNQLAGSLMEEFSARSAKAVAITERDWTARELYRKNALVVVGDPKDEETFSAANVREASFVIACSEDDTENALIAITAKAVNPNVKVIARLTRSDDIPKIVKAGAHRTVMPEATAGADIGNVLIERLKGKA